MSRRRFLRAVPAALAAGAVPALARQPQQPDPPSRVPKESIDCAEKLAGLDFTTAEEEMMLRGVNRNLESYEALRKIDIPLDTEPAVTFRPYLPGKRPSPGATPNARIRYTSARPLTPFRSVDELAFLPVTALAPLVEARKVTSTELTKMYLARLKAHGETLKAVVTLTEALALEQAADADREIAAGRYRGPLHGIPWGAKDLFATRGIRTTWGAKPYEDQTIDLDATVVERLRDAGAVLLAKLSMGALAQGGDWFGRSTRNPWNLKRSSSGSSAGPGAATAAGLVGFAVGTETLGSIISPAAANGVVGLRPTYGRVSRHGAMALSWTMDKIGPMCRTVEDCALVLNAIYGPDGHDETVVDAPFKWKPDVPLGGLKVGYVKREFEDVPETLNEENRRERAEQNKILSEALDALRKAGVALEPLELPAFPAQAVRFVLSAEAAAAFDDLTRSRGVDTLTAQGSGDWPNSFRTSRFIPAVEYIRAQRARTLLMREMDALMQKYHAVVTPNRSASLTMTNLTGHPAIGVKAGFAGGMPVCLMFTGRLYQEATILRLALAYERATDWHRKHPTMT
jgi:Asp-tRNA(Asn)/Glu-tRNA(Gln) amidotransferase A subunit family amidase